MTKARLSLLDPRGLTVEGLLALFRQLTGREPSPEEVERVRLRIAARKRGLKHDPSSED